ARARGLGRIQTEKGRPRQTQMSPGPFFFRSERVSLGGGARRDEPRRRAARTVRRGQNTYVLSTMRSRVSVRPALLPLVRREPEGHRQGRRTERGRRAQRPRRAPQTQGDDG